MDDSVVQALGAQQRHGGLRAALGEQPRALADGDRVDEQVQLVDQAVGDQGADQGGAAADVDAAVDAVLELAIFSAS